MKTIFSLRNFTSLTLSAFLLFQSSCYKDSIEALYPTGACDSTQASWSATIEPLIQTNCNNAGCHDAAASGAYDLRTYASVKTIADNGLLLQVLEDGSMPKNSAALDPCSIAKIRNWVNDGALKN